MKGTNIMGAWGQAWDENDTTMDDIDGMIGQRLTSVKSLSSTMTATVDNEEFIDEQVLDKYRSDFMILMTLCKAFDKAYYLDGADVDALSITNDMLLSYMQELENAINKGAYESAWVDFDDYSDTVMNEMRELNQWLDSLRSLN